MWPSISSLPPTATIHPSVMASASAMVLSASTVATIPPRSTRSAGVGVSAPDCESPQAAARMMPPAREAVRTNRPPDSVEYFIVSVFLLVGECLMCPSPQ